MNNPNIKIQKYHNPDGSFIKYMNIYKKLEDNDTTISLALALQRLENNNIDFVNINDEFFVREHFEFKTSKNFNKSKAISVFITKFEIEFYKSLI